MGPGWNERPDARGDGPGAAYGGRLRGEWREAAGDELFAEGDSSTEDMMHLKNGRTMVEVLSEETFDTE